MLFVPSEFLAFLQIKAFGIDLLCCFFQTVAACGDGSHLVLVVSNQSPKIHGGYAPKTPVKKCRDAAQISSQYTVALCFHDCTKKMYSNILYVN